MENKEILSNLVAIHNLATEINVKGEDAITMAQLLQRCRAIIYNLKESVSESTPN